jgi:hypothetical protein
MYYEEKLINNILHYRQASGGDWVQVPIETMSVRLFVADKEKDRLMKQISDIRYELNSFTYNDYSRPFPCS